LQADHIPVPKSSRHFPIQTFLLFKISFGNRLISAFSQGLDNPLGNDEIDKSRKEYRRHRSGGICKYAVYFISNRIQ
jgi:hypothetical protein